ncbi:MAG: hypothetical protein IPN34_14930 [Planctomycetes bacterium]|nr:hypothetical protein [Planctomycetota bacterium]
MARSVRHISQRFSVSILGALVVAATAACTGAPPARGPYRMVEKGPALERSIEVCDGSAARVAEFRWIEVVTIPSHVAEGRYIPPEWCKQEAFLSLREMGTTVPASAHVEFEPSVPSAFRHGWDDVIITPGMIRLEWTSGALQQHAILRIDSVGQLSVETQEPFNSFALVPR